MSVSDGVRVAVPFVWLGAVLAISFLEAPLKFRAPGITAPLGLGIGRLVFRALNLLELGLAAALVGAVLVGRPVGSAAVIAVLGALVGVLVVQTVLLRTRLDRRARLLLAGETPPPSRHHLVYLGLEAAKTALLLTLGVLLLAGLSG